MKISTLAAATIAATALIGGSVFAQDAAPAATMQPVPNPPEAAKPMHHGGHHHKHHRKHHHAKAMAASTAAPAK